MLDVIKKTGRKCTEAFIPCIAMMGLGAHGVAEALSLPHLMIASQTAVMAVAQLWFCWFLIEKTKLGMYNFMHKKATQSGLFGIAVTIADYISHHPPGMPFEHIITGVAAMALSLTADKLFED